MTISDRLGDYIERNEIVLHTDQSVARQFHTFWIATRASKSAEEETIAENGLMSREMRSRSLFSNRTFKKTLNFSISSTATHANRALKEKAARATKLPRRANLRKR